jgi:short-subunit dehydrogenase
MKTIYTIITGASSGIGKEFAYFYAQKKKNLILIARRTERLEEIKQHLQRKYNIQIEIITADLTKTQDIKTIITTIHEKKYTIETLINNAGINQAGAVIDLTIQQINDIINTNTTSMVLLCNGILPIMKQQGKGKILNIASIAGFMPCENYALYFATKAFVINFTESLHQECKNLNIKVSALCPGFTKTAIVKSFPKIGSLADPKKVVAYGDKILNKNQTLGIHGRKNKITVFLMQILPKNRVRSITSTFKNKEHFTVKEN